MSVLCLFVCVCSLAFCLQCWRLEASGQGRAQVRAASWHYFPVFSRGGKRAECESCLCGQMFLCLSVCVQARVCVSVSVLCVFEHGHVRRPGVHVCLRRSVLV